MCLLLAYSQVFSFYDLASYIRVLTTASRPWSNWKHLWLGEDWTDGSLTTTTASATSCTPGWPRAIGYVPNRWFSSVFPRRILLAEMSFISSRLPQITQMGRYRDAFGFLELTLLLYMTLFTFTFLRKYLQVIMLWNGSLELVLLVNVQKVSSNAKGHLLHLLLKNIWDLGNNSHSYF